MTTLTTWRATDYKPLSIACNATEDCNHLTSDYTTLDYGLRDYGLLIIQVAQLGYFAFRTSLG
jgi:hypothetical protein